MNFLFKSLNKRNWIFLSVLILFSCFSCEPHSVFQHPFQNTVVWTAPSSIGFKTKIQICIYTQVSFQLCFQDHHSKSLCQDTQVPHATVLLPFPELLLPRECSITPWEWPVLAVPYMALPAKSFSGNGPMFLTSSTLRSDSITPSLPSFASLDVTCEFYHQ